MRILYIDGDYDYSLSNFEYSECSVEDLVEQCEKSENNRVSMENGDCGFNAELFEFGEVDPKFVEFIQSKQNYDHAKHANFVVID